MKRRKLIGLALVCATATFIQAQQIRESATIAPDLTLSAPEKYAGFNSVSLLDSTDVTVQENGSGSFVIHRVVKVMNRQGAQDYRVLKYDYDPLTADAEFYRVTIYKANGDVHNLDINLQLDYAAPARMIYWGARQIMMEVGHLDPGDILDYQINKKGFTYALLADGADDESRFIPPMRGQFYDIVPFWATEPTLRKVYRVTVPANKELQFQFYQGECASSMRYDERGSRPKTDDVVNP